LGKVPVWRGEEKGLFYFAYASNLNRKQMAERAPQAKARLSATLPNYKLMFAGWSRTWRGAVATIQQSHGDRVLGGVYELTEQDMEKLARFEGEEYGTTRVTVFPDTGPAIEAVTFVRTRQKEEGKPSPEYLAVIKQGYSDWGLI
jgi:gamma-glutamylcyclotransferase